MRPPVETVEWGVWWVRVWDEGRGGKHGVRGPVVIVARGMGWEHSVHVPLEDVQGTQKTHLNSSRHWWKFLGSYIQCRPRGMPAHLSGELSGSVFYGPSFLLLLQFLFLADLSVCVVYCRTLKCWLCISSWDSCREPRSLVQRRQAVGQDWEIQGWIERCSSSWLFKNPHSSSRWNRCLSAGDCT